MYLCLVCCIIYPNGGMMKKEFLKVFKPKEGWIEIDKSLYSVYGLDKNSQAKVVSAYKIGKFLEAENTLAIYDYGKQKSLLDDIDAEYKDLQLDIKLQDEYGAFPEHWEHKGNMLYSVLRLVKSPNIRMVDIFLNNNGNIYCVHTYLDKSDKDLSLDAICKKYKDIGYILDEIGNL